MKKISPSNILKGEGLWDKKTWRKSSWKKAGIRIAFFGIENQTKTDPNMVIRTLCYDAASYRAQVREKIPNGRKFPVVSLVLYFGTTRWTAPVKLSQMLEPNDALRSHWNDYRINLVEVAFLSDEQIEKFQSDFRVVAEYFRSLREDREFSPKKIEHVEEVLDLLAAVTKDDRYLDILGEEWLNQEGGVTMCELLDRYIKRGEERGIKKGIEQGIEQGIERGIEQGIEQGIKKGEILGAITILKKLDYSDSEIVEKLLSTFDLSRADAESYVKAG